MQNYYVPRDDYDLRRVIHETVNEPVREIYGHANGFVRQHRRTRGDGLKQDYQNGASVSKVHPDPTNFDENEENNEIEKHDIVASKQVDALLQSTRQLLTRRIHFLPAKKRDQTSHLDNLVPLNKEKTVFEYRAPISYVTLANYPHLVWKQQ